MIVEVQTDLERGEDCWHVVAEYAVHPDRPGGDWDPPECGEAMLRAIEVTDAMGQPVSSKALTSDEHAALVALAWEAAEAAADRLADRNAP